MGLDRLGEGSLTGPRLGTKRPVPLPARLVDQQIQRHDARARQSELIDRAREHLASPHPLADLLEREVIDGKDPDITAGPRDARRDGPGERVFDRRLHTGAP